MTIDVENVFKAETKSSHVLLAQGGNGLYIPAYQREYSWEKKDVGRLFEDTCQGVRQLFKREDAITFIGSIILIKDNRHETINPRVKGHVPGGVLLVIDGQQRLTTLVLTNLLLHNFLEVRAQRIRADGEVGQWIREQKQQLLARLRDTFELDFNVGDDSYRYYPKIIRAFDDSWSWQPQKAQYTSPIAALIRAYIEHSRNTPSKKFNFNDKGARFQTLRTAYREVNKWLKRVAAGPVNDTEDEAGIELLSTQ